jgi:hypothetical protein
MNIPLRVFCDASQTTISFGGVSSTFLDCCTPDRYGTKRIRPERTVKMSQKGARAKLDSAFAGVVVDYPTLHRTCGELLQTSQRPYSIRISLKVLVADETRMCMLLG